MGLRDSQLRDRDIGLVMQALDQRKGRPAWAKVSDGSQGLRTLWGQWKRLSIQDGVLYRKWEDGAGLTSRWKVVVPSEKKKEVLFHVHDSPAAGHLGVSRPVERVRQGFFWVGIKRDVRRYCRQCDACTGQRLPNGAPKVPMQQYQVGSPMSRIGIDIQGPFPKSKSGNTVILVIEDYFSKWVEAVPLPNQEAVTVAKALTERWICARGPS